MSVRGTLHGVHVSTDSANLGHCVAPPQRWSSPHAVSLSSRILSSTCTDCAQWLGAERVLRKWWKGDRGTIRYLIVCRCIAAELEVHGELGARTCGQMFGQG